MGTGCASREHSAARSTYPAPRIGPVGHAGRFAVRPAERAVQPAERAVRGAVQPAERAVQPTERAVRGAVRPAERAVRPAERAVRGAVRPAERRGLNAAGSFAPPAIPAWTSPGWTTPDVPFTAAMFAP